MDKPDQGEMLKRVMEQARAAGEKAEAEAAARLLQLLQDLRKGKPVVYVR